MKMAKMVGIIVRDIVKSCINVVGLSKLLTCPSGGVPPGIVQRSTPGNKEANTEAIVILAGNKTLAEYTQ